MGRPLRVVGTACLVTGAAVLVWVVLVWRWQDPVTAVYTWYEQRQLAGDLHRRSMSEAEVVRRVQRMGAARAPASEAQVIAVLARRYRLATKPGEAIGRIVVPRLDLRMIVVDSTQSAALRRGPGLDRRSALPGEGRLVFIAGHRTTFLAPFAHIDELRRGDRVVLELPYATFVYSVTGHSIVPATDMSVLRPGRTERLALQACHPRFFATHRYIVWAVPRAVTPRGTRAYFVDAARAARRASRRLGAQRR